MFLSKNDIPGLRRLITAALKRNATPQVIMDLLERAVRSFRTAKGFSERDLDIALIVKALGGPRLLFAMQRAYGLPSLSTLRRRQHIPTMLASVGTPTAEDAGANIDAFCNPDVRPPREPSKPGGRLPGNVAMFDGIALETKCSYDPKRDEILGLCREHVGSVQTKLTEMEVINVIQRALFSPDDTTPKVCLGMDATVVGIGPYARRDQYMPWPLVASATDKTEKGKALAEWIAVVLKQWKEHPFGEALHGPIWTLASDGDSAYRLAKHIYCLLDGREIDRSTEAGRVLHLLDGLNLVMSTDGVTGTCDPKHIFKRTPLAICFDHPQRANYLATGFATLLRNVDGVMVNETQVVPTDIVENLSSIPGVSHDKALNLLDPADKQNVPKAVSFIQHLNMLKTKVPPPRRAHKCHRYEVLTFMGEFLSYFMNPFIDVTMDLADQVQSLSTFSHIAVALYLRHRTACLTGPLYADCQMVVKNIIFTIARLQEIDPNAELFIIHEGTDRLERLFGEVRTQDHARNFDLKQVTEKLSIATLLNAAFHRNADLDSGHRRLSLKDALGVDHVNPESWEGAVRVGDVNLPLQWSRGREKAIEVLKDHFPEMVIPDFDTIFQEEGIDILRPTKAGYVGTSNDVNDKRSEVERDVPVAGSTPSTSTGPTNPGSAGEGHPSASTPVGAPPIPQSDATQDGDMDVDPLPSVAYEFVPEDPALLYGDDYTSVFSDESDGDESDEDDGDNGGEMEEQWDDDLFGPEIPIGVELEDMLSDSVDDHLVGNPCAGTPGRRVPLDDDPRYLKVDGKPYLKSSLVAMLSSKYSKKVTMRVLRARGVAAETALVGSDDRRRFDDSNLDDADLLKSSDLVALLVKTTLDSAADPRTIGLALMEITGFKEGSRLHASLASSRLRESSIRVVGQLLELRQTVEIGSDHEAWEWAGRYLRLNVSSADPVVTRRQFVVEVPGMLIFPLKANTVEVSSSSRSGRLTLPITWEISSSSLNDTCAEAWSALSPSTAEVVGNLNVLPVVINSTLFPYTNRRGTPQSWTIN